MGCPSDNHILMPDVYITTGYFQFNGAADSGSGFGILNAQIHIFENPFCDFQVMSADVKSIILPHRFSATKNANHQFIFQTPVITGKLMNKIWQSGGGIIAMPVDGLFL